MNSILDILACLELDCIDGFKFKKEFGGKSSFSALYENHEKKVVFKFLIFPRNNVELERFNFEYQALYENIANRRECEINDHPSLFMGPDSSYPLPKIVHNIKSISEKIFYFSYEFEEGDLLSGVENSKLVFSEKIELLYRLSSAMNYFGRTGYEHRDLHPENILLKPNPCMQEFIINGPSNISAPENDPRIVFLDMGTCKIKKRSGELNRHFFIQNHNEDLIENENCKRVLSSFTSMPPDFLLKGRETKNYDSWALGVYAYRLLFGRLPFEPESINDVYKILNSQWDISCYKENLNSLPIALRLVLQHLLAFKGEERPPIYSIVRLFGWIKSDDHRFKSEGFIKRVIHNDGFDPDHNPIDDYY
ncbi:hypothetical protein A8139_05160 [Marinomonas primoryensis]|uniref:Protein kinase domain-containing protein n=1 Tax=Marinomonas primoryensis TaxID=178399 RepID=A0A2Z4PQX4_9GAMM|nr:hypothetical protein [Marinomonas primoryensis]AWX99453.1 hypothetical protein A8139_05160 [Marinomonas primoryensis]